MREKDSDALLSDVEDLARRQPWAVGAGAMVLGFVASRFLKASSSRRYSARYGQSSLPEPAGSSEAPTAPLSEPATMAGEVSTPAGGTHDAAAAGRPGA
jgi:hypothetical protein